MDQHKTATARKMVYEMADLLAREEKQYAGQTEPSQFRITVIPFGSLVGQLKAQRPLEVVTGWPSSIAHYNDLGGMTALRDAIGRALELAEKSTAQAKLVSIFTDGGENHSYQYSIARLTALLTKLEARGDLTVTLAGPAIARDHLADVGIPAANFRDWDGSEQGLQATAAATTNALQTYVDQRRVGATRSTSFYSTDNLGAITPAGIKANTKAVNPREVRTVTRHMAGRTIADFYGRAFEQGNHYYQLVKPEYLQDSKELVVYIKAKGEYRQGSRSVRSLMGLPETGKIRLHPAKLDQYDLYIQSTSNNRKVVEGQQLLTL
jgi:hypothetical protein